MQELVILSTTIVLLKIFKILNLIGKKKKPFMKNYKRKFKIFIKIATKRVATSSLEYACSVTRTNKISHMYYSTPTPAYIHIYIWLSLK